jgi:hypothetical protein
MTRRTQDGNSWIAWYASQRAQSQPTTVVCSYPDRILCGKCFGRKSRTEPTSPDDDLVVCLDCRVVDHP